MSFFQRNSPLFATESYTPKMTNQTKTENIIRIHAMPLGLLFGRNVGYIYNYSSFFTEQKAAKYQHQGIKNEVIN